MSSKTFASSQVFAMHLDDKYKKNIVELQNNTDETMDTSKWITHPVGRYLIKLPPAAQIKWGPLQFGRRYELTWEKDLSYKGALAKLEEIKKEQLRNGVIFRDFVSTRLQENFSPQKRGTLLTADYDTDSQMDDVSYDMYVVNKKSPMDIDFPERIYYFNKDLVPYSQDLSAMNGWLSHMKGEKSLSSNTRIAAEKFITHVADNIAPHDPSLPIETVRGIYFEGGFLFDPLDDTLVYPKDEVIEIEVTFVDYPDISLKISFNDYHYPGLIAETDYMDDVHIGFKTEENTTIAGEPANERLTTFTTSTKYADSNTPRYFFTLASPATISYKPQIGMVLANDPVDTLDKPSFESDEAAIAFWNAIKENIRWRPDNWKVKAPDGPYFKIYDEIIPAIIPQ